MSFNGSGVFQINSSGQPVVTGTTISSTVFNALTSDLATGLSTAICKDGQTTITANIPMSGWKFTGLGAGSAATDSVRLSQLQSGAGFVLGTIAGTNTITAVGSPTVTAYAANQVFEFIPAATNTGATTLNIDSLGAKNVFLRNAACSGGELVIGVPVRVMYDGTQFQIVATGALVTTTTTQTLTNKTLTSPTLNSPTMTTPTLGVASATSINFGQTALSYYGEGTWTPSLGGSATYTTQTGIYTRVGRLINCQCDLNVNAIGTGSTSTISGLPFTVNGTASGQVGTFSTLATNVLGFWCYAASTVVTFQSLTVAGTSATNSPAIFGSGASLRCSVTFHI